MAGGAHRVRENLTIVAGLEKAMVRNLPDPRVRASHDAGDSSQGLEAVAEKLDGFRGVVPGCPGVLRLRSAGAPLRSR